LAAVRVEQQAALRASEARLNTIWTAKLNATQSELAEAQARIERCEANDAKVDRTDARLEQQVGALAILASTFTYTEFESDAVCQRVCQRHSIQRQIVATQAVHV
jgi:hypothetical protein